MKYLKGIAWILLAPLLLMNTQCDDEDLSANNCGQNAVIDSSFFKSAISHEFNLTSFDLNEDCLSVEIDASGCDGESWSLVLVDSGSVQESLPPQRYLKVIFSNEEECLAAISQSRVFNLTNLRVEGVNEVLLHIEGIPESLSYRYP